MSLYSLVEAANEITPTIQLWTQRSADTTLNAMVTWSDTEAYYYDFQKGGDDAIIFANAWQRDYTLPSGVMTPAASGTATQVKTGAILEAALSMRLAGTSDTYYFFPDHGTPTCFLVARNWWRDGVELTAVGTNYVRCENTVIDSLYDCIHPDQTDPLARMRIMHTITKSHVQADVSVEFKRACQISDGYSIMTAASGMTSPRLAAVSVNAPAEAMALTGSNQAATGQGGVTGIAMGKSGVSTVIVADWPSIDRVLNNEEFTDASLFQWFIASTNKFYNQPFNDCQIPIGRTFRWTGRWRLAEWESILT
jgi:hypothetical protein